VDLRTKLAVLHFVHCDAALWAATLGMATTVPSLWHKIRCVRVLVCICVCVCVCVCACVCIALLGYVWHGDHRTLIVAQDQVRACTSVYVCVCAWLCWALFGMATTVPSLWHKIRCVHVRVCMCACVCIALLGYVWHGDHRTLIVAQDQVRACTSVCVYLCVGVCVCVALLGYVLHGDHRTLIVAHDQVCACTSVYLCVCMCVRGFVGLCLAWRPLYPLLWHKIRCVRVRV